MPKRLKEIKIYKYKSVAGKYWAIERKWTEKGMMYDDEARLVRIDPDGEKTRYEAKGQLYTDNFSSNIDHIDTVHDLIALVDKIEELGVCFKTISGREAEGWM